MCVCVRASAHNDLYLTCWSLATSVSDQKTKSRENSLYVTFSDNVSDQERTLYNPNASHPLPATVWPSTNTFLRGTKSKSTHIQYTFICICHDSHNFSQCSVSPVQITKKVFNQSPHKLLTHLGLINIPLIIIFNCCTYIVITPQDAT